MDEGSVREILAGKRNYYRRLITNLADFDFAVVSSSTTIVKTAESYEDKEDDLNFLFIGKNPFE